MKVEQNSEYEYRLLFDKDEVIFLNNESSDNKLSIIEILTMVLSVLFVSGYRNIVGKD